jgi:LuxR family maltose regulon positive regulatory protein
VEQQSESVQTFLLQTAVLDRLTGSLCDAVCSKGTATGQDNGQHTLEMLEQANLFIVPLDNERHWYRYHHLFADLLRQRLHQTQPDRLPTLHSKASEWYEQKGFIDEAIEHALRGQYFERAATLLEDQFGDNYEHIDQTLLRRWLAEMPEELVCSRPRLCILHAWNLFSFGHLDAAGRRLQTAEKMLDRDIDQELDSSPDKDQLSDTNRMELAGRVAVIRSFLVSYSGDMPGTIQYASQALEYLPEQELQWRSAALIALGDAYAGQGQMAAAHKARSDALAAGKASGDIYILTIVNLSLAEVLRQQGKLQQVIDICERQLKRADDGGISESALVGWLFGIWGEVLAELNDLDRAIDQAKKGVKLAARGRDVFHIASSNLYLVRVLFSSGDITGAEDVIQSMENTAREYDLPLRTLLELSAWQVRMWLAQDKLEAASQWVADRELDPQGELTYLHEMEYIVFARILIAQGRLGEATPLLQRLLEAAEAEERTSKVIEILILQTLAAHSGGDTDQAMSTLKQALTLAGPGGFIRIFVDEGPPMAELLTRMKDEGGRMKEYVHKLLAAFGMQKDVHPFDSAQDKSSSLIPQPLIEPLSEREIEVLQLIAEGLTNREIANRLYLSLNTVKVHTRNIYGKLGVNHRTKAVAQAQRLGLLKPK